MSNRLLPEGLSIANRMVYLDDQYFPDPNLISACDACGRLFLQSPHSGQFSHSLPVVFTDGACLKNGGDFPQAGYGVAIDNHSQEPCVFSFSGHDERSSRKAELAGVKKGLELGIEMMQQGPVANCLTASYDNFVLVTDSEYSVKAITEWLPRRKANNFRTSTGRRPVNETALREIDTIMNQYEAQGCRIGLLHVNVDADWLAGQSANRNRGPPMYQGPVGGAM
ncbi:ribonuclease H-like domain-containing protein [Phyllosticta citricarpa]|uniref:ribonuclease H n=2 Tax=Phyllosticta TaxID=121621 RepID=A0ABR1MDB5_9PEZI